MLKRSISLFVLIVVCSIAVYSQTTEFTYQGSLKSGGTAATGTFDFEFLLFDSGGNQIGGTLQRGGVLVANGIFKVDLDFGSGFTGAGRLLEIRVRSSGGGAYTTLAPRQSVSSSPYSIKTLSADTATNASQLGGIPANQYLQSNGNGSALTNLNATNITSGTISNSRLGQIVNSNIADLAVTGPKIAVGSVVKNINSLSDSVTLAAGANITITPSGNTLTFATTPGNAILNQTTQQPTANFNIAGSGTASIFSAGTQYNIGSDRVLSVAGTNNTFAGAEAGLDTTTGALNAFFGRQAGLRNTTGTSNAYFGGFAGFTSTTASSNSFFGAAAGPNTSTGGSNSFFGESTGLTNTTGSNNTLIGKSANVGTGALTFATAIGAEAIVGASNSLVLGTTIGPGTNVGIGTGVPRSRLDVRGNIQVGNVTNLTALAFGEEAVFINNANGHASNTFRLDANNNNLYIIGRSDAGANTGAGIIFRTATAAAGEIDRVLINFDGTVRINNLGDAGSTHVCHNSVSALAFCSSSRRYKTDISNYRGGLDLLQRFRPVEFSWKASGKRDVGFVAEEVAEIEPLLTFNNPAGDIEGVNYAQITTVLVNAAKEQQSQIESQKAEIKALSATVEALKKIICATDPAASICKTQ